MSEGPGLQNQESGSQREACRREIGNRRLEIGLPQPAALDHWPDRTHTRFAYRQFLRASTSPQPVLQTQPAGEFPDPHGDGGIPWSPAHHTIRLADHDSEETRILFPPSSECKSQNGRTCFRRCPQTGPRGNTRNLQWLRMKCSK